MRTISEWIPFFQKELDQIGRPPWHLSAQSLFQVMARRHTQAADVACREFCRRLTWPPLTEEVRFEVCLRLLCVLKYCESERGLPIDPEEHGSAALKSFLLSYWKDVGREQLLYDVLLKPHIKHFEAIYFDE
jgi:hypothetical protein